MKKRTYDAYSPFIINGYFINSGILYKRSLRPVCKLNFQQHSSAVALDTPDVTVEGHVCILIMARNAKVNVSVVHIFVTSQRVAELVVRVRLKLFHNKR